jgi:cytoskeletal protein CcmA (bactofilin family)
VANGGSTFSVIGADVVIKGDLSASADLHVDGTVEGDIGCASLVQGEASRIHGAIEAASARLAGRVNGTITVRELVILKTAVIEGDIHYDTLTVEQGAQLEGRMAHGATKTAQRPTLAAAKADADDDGKELLLTVSG